MGSLNCFLSIKTVNFVDTFLQVDANGTIADTQAHGRVAVYCLFDPRTAGGVREGWGLEAVTGHIQR